AWATQKMQGMGDAPEAVSLEEFAASEGETLFRGVSSTDHKEQFLSGDNWVGTGGNGTGIYFSTDKSHAGQYANFDDDQIIEVKLKPDAKIVDAQELYDQQQKDFAEAMESGNKLAAQLSSGDLNLYASAIGV